MKLLLLLALVAFLEARPQRPEAADSKCKTGPIDLVFIIDSSRSVRPFEFETMRKFMIDIIHTLDVGANATRVGVVQYSSQVQNVFSLKSFTRKADMVKAINEIIPLAQGTMTGLAIQYAMSVAFSPEEGARRGVPSVAVIVTDGRPQDRVAEVAAQARDRKIEIYAVGVARADMTSLRAMASPPLKDHVFLVESFDLIHQFGLQFQDKLCGVDLCTEMDHGCQHICVSSPGSYHCECRAGYTLNTDSKTCSAIDLCAGGKHSCEQICVSSPGSYTCRCRAGFYLNQDKMTCTMIDYCSFGNHSCQHECVSVLNGYFCRCNEGYTLLDDGKTCQSHSHKLIRKYSSLALKSLVVMLTCALLSVINRVCGFVLKTLECHYCPRLAYYNLFHLLTSSIHKIIQSIPPPSPDYRLFWDQLLNHTPSPEPQKPIHDPPALIPKPPALSPKLSALSPKPTALIPKPSALSPKPSALMLLQCLCLPLDSHLSLPTVEDLCNTVEHGCEHRCVSAPGSYHCVCPEGQLLQEDGKSCSTCRSANIDLVMVIDGSKSVRPQNFELVKQFVNQVVDSLDVSAHGTRVGLVQYSSRVRTEFPLSQYKSAEDIKNAVLKVEYMEKGTMTGLALKHLVENSFSEAEGARPPSKGIPRVGLVFTDGRSQDDITEWAKKAKDAALPGITMYAVGVGKALEEELREIASEPVDKHFFYTTDFTAINQIAENLKLNICAEESQGEIEVKDPCACESLVEFQQSTLSTLEQLTQKHILSKGMTARLEDLENQLL
uniref:Matrilin 4 n=1 Tax=Lepisosteus oculatus TaxID=7918 RepID=W5MLJ9_LEPOC